VIVSVGRLEGVTVSTLCRFVWDVEVEDVVEDVWVDSGEGRPRARRRRVLKGIGIALTS